MDGEKRLGGIGDYIASELMKKTETECRVTALGHVQRGAPPTASDRSLASAFGVYAVDLLNQKKSLLLNNLLIKNFIKIVISTFIMSFLLLLALESFESYLEYSSKYKAIYLISIVGFVGILYLLSCYLLGILKLKNYKMY